jgi:outer membrane lipopolysaccharide assembly protein LptE/RlpB
MRALALIAVLGLASCGYHLGAPNSRLPAGVTKVRIPLAVNRTAEPNCEVLVTEAVREGYARAGKYDEQSETALELTVLSVMGAPFLAGPGRQPTYRLQLQVEVKLNRAGAIVAQFVSTQKEEFPSGGDTLLTESNRASALKRLAELVGRDVGERFSN